MSRSRRRGRTRSLVAGVRDALRRLRPPTRAVPALACLALAVRLWGLGDRSMHFDEARVGYWTLRYVETGYYAYRPIVHGPLLELATAPVLGALGPSDFAVRLLPAVLGACLPLAALGFRGALDDAETVALAGFLAVNPLLLFFSRFFRADVPLAALAFGAVALGYRALRTGRRRHLLAAGLLAGLALTTKENALVYLACVAGAAGVALATLWLRGRRSDRDDGGAGAVRAALSRARPLLPAVAPALGLAVAVAWFFYVPRGYSPGLDDLAARPLAALAAGTVGAAGTFAGSLWASGHAHPYLPFLAHLLGTLAVGAPALYACALVGAGVELRRLVAPAGRPARPLVLAAFAWGVASLVGYPLGADIMAPWLAVHVVVPLAVPAAAGGVALARRVRAWWTAGSAASAAGDARPPLRLRALAVGLVVALAVAQAGFVVYATSYTSPVPRPNFIAQGAQPGDDLDPLVADIEAARGAGGLLYYGERFELPNESVADRPPRDNPPWLGVWLSRLPLPWYVERAGVEHRQASTVDALPADPPPVVVASAAEAAEVAPELPGYERREYDLLLFGGTVVAFTDPARTPSAPAGTPEAAAADRPAPPDSAAETAPISVAAPPERHTAPDDRRSAGGFDALNLLGRELYRDE